MFPSMGMQTKASPPSKRWFADSVEGALIEFNQLLRDMKGAPVSERFVKEELETGFGDGESSTLPPSPHIVGEDIGELSTMRGNGAQKSMAVVTQQ